MSKARSASVDHPLSGKVKEEKLVEPVGFGEADVPGEVEEVEVARDVGTSSALAIDIDDIQPTESELPHTRSECPKFPFGESQNKTHCPKCYCYVCDIPVCQCTDWHEHCHAHDNAHWNQERYAKRNSLFALLKTLVNGEIKLNSRHALSPFECNEKVRSDIDRAWRLYEAGVHEREGTFVHKFGSVTGWFKKYFIMTVLKANDKEWAIKFIVLDAMTEIIIARTWKLPEGSKYESTDPDQSPENLMDRILLSLGSRWITMTAACPIHMRFLVLKCVRERLGYFQRITKDNKSFGRTFSFLVDISKFGVSGEEHTVVMAVATLYKSINKRQAHALLSDLTCRRVKYHDVYTKDDILLPFAASIISHLAPTINQMEEDKKSSLLALQKRCDFYHRPSRETWNLGKNKLSRQILCLCQLYKDSEMVYEDHIRDFTRDTLYMFAFCKANIYSTRAGKRSKELMVNIDTLMYVFKDVCQCEIRLFRQCAESLRYCIQLFMTIEKLSKGMWAFCERTFNAFDELPSKLAELSQNTVLEMGEWIWHKITESERKDALQTIESRCGRMIVTGSLREGRFEDLQRRPSIWGLAKSVFENHGEHCNICMEGYTAQKPFAITCPCSRATRIHRDCLDQWRRAKPDRAHQCHICHTRYKGIDTVALGKRRRGEHL